MRNVGVSRVEENMSSTLSKELLNEYITSFINAAENGDVNALNNLLELTKSDPISQKEMIHAHQDRAFWSTAKNGHIEAMKFLVKITQNYPEELKQMIHAGRDDVFWHAAVNGHIEAMKLLIELTQNDPQGQKQMIHAEEDSVFWYTISNNHIEAAKFLVELTKNDPQEQKQMVHAGEDGAFKEAVENDNQEMIKFLVTLDPFYPWEPMCNQEVLQKIKPYLGIDIKQLANFSIIRKYPFSRDDQFVFSINLKSGEEENKQKKVAKILPKEIIMHILNFLSGGTTQQIDSGIEAFKWNEGENKEPGFNSFTKNYEQKLMYFDNEQNDNIELAGQEGANT